MKKKLKYVIKNNGDWANGLELGQIYEIHKDQDKDITIYDECDANILLTDKELKFTHMNINSRLDCFVWVDEKYV